MLKRCLGLCFFTLIIVCGVFSSASILTYTADSLEYRDDAKEIILRGNCKVIYNDTELHADTIYYMVEDETMLAVGNVELKSGSTPLTGRILEYDLKNKEANIHTARVPVEKGYVTGEQITAEGDDTLFGYNTNFTTCNHSSPHYRIYSERMKVMKDNKIVISPVIFYVGNVPLMYLPSYLIPIPKGRKTGFLAPGISNNTIDGLTLTNAFFLVINAYSDLTYTAKYMSLRGLQHGGEFRFKTRRGDGFFDTKYLNDNLYNTRRWELKGNARQDIPEWGMSMYAQSNFFSDTALPSDLGENYDERTANQANSYISFTKSIPSLATITLVANQDRSWWTNYSGAYDKKVNSLPAYTVSFYNIPITKNMYASLNSSGSNKLTDIFFNETSPDYSTLYKDEAFQEQTIITTAALTYRYDVLKYLRTSFTSSHQFEHYDQDGTILERWVPTTSLTAYTDIFGYFNLFNIGATDMIKHRLTPSIGFSYIPDLPQERFVAAKKGKIYPRESINYALNNTFLTKNNVDGKAFQFLTANFSINQDLLKDERNFSELMSNYSFTPYLGTLLRNRTQISHSYDTYTRETTRINVMNTLTYTWGKNNSFDATMAYIKNKGSDEIVNARARTNYWFTQNWRLTHEIVYNAAKNKIESQTYELYRNLHCWHMSIRWELRENGAMEYKFYIQLNAYDDFKWDYQKRFDTEEE